jgi:hypothetical protein
VAFVVEDGSGLTNSTSYADVAFADNYHADRGHGSWAALNNTLKQQCLIRATDYVDKRFGRRFRGNRVRRTQARQWPRYNVFDAQRLLIVMSDEVPWQVEQAVAEYALRAALVGELAPDPIPNVPRQDLSPATPVVPTEYTGGQVKRVSEKVDVIEETKSYQGPEDLTVASRNKNSLSTLVTDGFIPEYPAADMLLEELMTSGQRTVTRG